MRGEGYTTDENLLASQLLTFCEGMLSRFVRSNLNTAQRTISTPAGRSLPLGYESNADWIVAHALSGRRNISGKAPPGNSLYA